MSKFQEDAKELLRLVGGKENIRSVAHCMTRMRFVLVEPKKADNKAIEALKSVKGTFTQAGQFQVIIGNEVSVFYQDFIKLAGIEGVSKDAVKQAAKSNQNLAQRLVGSLAEIFAPLIPAIITGGLILGFRNIIGDIRMVDGGTQTLAEAYVFWNGLYNFLWLLGEAIFHFLPVGICWSITKKMGTTPILGIVLGITLVSPQLINAYAVGSVPMTYWDFGFFKMQMAGYQGQVIPAMLAGFTLVYLERFFRKITPAVISMIVVPFCSLVLAVIFAHGILGPIGWTLGKGISSVIYTGLTSPLKGLFGAVFGFFYAPLVITGLHHMSNAIDLQLINDFQGTILWPMIALSNIAQGSAVLGMIYLQKKNEQAQQINIPSCISCYLGVTEPAIFGVNLKYKFPFICGMVGSAIAGALSVSTGVMANAVGVGGLPGILSIKPEFIVMFAVCMAVTIVVPFGLVMVLGKKKLSASERGCVAATFDSVEETHAQVEIEVSQGQVETAVRTADEYSRETDGCGQAADNSHKVFSPLTGEAVKLSDIEDEVFSQEVLGKGCAFRPSLGEVRAPFDAIVENIPDTKHAIGLTCASGVEVLIHVGMDTVELKGQYFEPQVSEGDKVKKGQLLLKFDLEGIKNAGYKTDTPVVVTNTNDYETVELIAPGNVTAGEPLLRVEK